MSTDLYYKHVGKFDLLNKQEEQALAKKASEGCLRSKHLLVEHNLRLALHIAKKYSKTKCSMEDLIAEANVGLCRAVEKFDYSKNHAWPKGSRTFLGRGSPPRSHLALGE